MNNDNIVKGSDANITLGSSILAEDEYYSFSEKLEEPVFDFYGMQPCNYVRKYTDSWGDTFVFSTIAYNNRLNDDWEFKRCERRNNPDNFKEVSYPTDWVYDKELASVIRWTSASTFEVKRD